MGLKSFLDNIIPNELKGNAGKILGAAAIGYLGYKYAPSAWSAAKNFVGTSSTIGGPANQYGKVGTGMMGYVDKAKSTYAKYKDRKDVKFLVGTGKSLAGMAQKGEDEAKARERAAAERARLERSIRQASYNKPSVGQPMGVGNFSVSKARVPGFNNSNVNESLNLMSYFMQDLNDNGRIDSSALHAEGSRGTTIRTSSAKNLQIGLS